MCVCVCVCVCVYIHTYIHTYIHIHAYTSSTVRTRNACSRGVQRVCVVCVCVCMRACVRVHIHIYIYNMGGLGRRPLISAGRTYRYDITSACKSMSTCHWISAGSRVYRYNIYCIRGLLVQYYKYV